MVNKKDVEKAKTTVEANRKGAKNVAKNPKEEIDTSKQIKTSNEEIKTKNNVFKMNQ